MRACFNSPSQYLPTTAGGFAHDTCGTLLSTSCGDMLPINGSSSIPHSPANFLLLHDITFLVLVHPYLCPCVCHPYILVATRSTHHNTRNHHRLPCHVHALLLPTLSEALISVLTCFRILDRSHVSSSHKRHRAGANIGVFKPASRRLSATPEASLGLASWQLWHLAR